MDIKMKVSSSGIPTTFDANLLNELQNSKPDEFLNYVDLTDELIVTMDGESAKDFDDAFMVKKIADEKFLLGVYIADVSRYVKPNTLVDQEALRRSFSCYLPNQVIPMLPNLLSDDLCSLLPNELRYTIACHMIINGGIIKEVEVFPALIKSKYRLVYEEVNDWFKKEVVPIGLSMLLDAKELALILENKRHDAGSLDFVTIESQITLDEQGRAINVDAVHRGIAEAMIEEFMIACNKSIAERIAYLDLPFLYRVHDEPNGMKLSEVRMIASELGIVIPKKQNSIHPLFIQQILEKPTTDEEKAIFNNLILRAMAKAKYQEYNIGHFGLALKNYTHFTSPIRRYPDLLVHRLIKQYLFGEELYQIDAIPSLLSEATCIVNQNERIIENLERDVDDMKKAEYMSTKIGKSYSGIISGIQKWGLYVQLNNCIEGMIASRELAMDDYYFDELHQDYSNLKGDKLKLGQSIMIEVFDADKERGTIDFILKTKGE